MAVGKDFVKLEHQELNIQEIIDSVVSPKCGAVSTFIGTTRDNFENKKVVKLEYEAYEPMAIKELLNVCSKIRSQLDVEHIAIHHRIGEVPVSKASVVIAISSPHRADSLRAVEFAIDTLKSTVPIWKKEVYDLETPEWKENKECAWSNSTTTDDSSLHAITNISNDSSIHEKHEVEGTSTKTEDLIVIDPNLVQIRASSDELKHRIESFIERKRQQANLVNVQEFCCYKENNEEVGNSCARVDAILIRRKDSTSHVKVHRVFNSWGPQTVDQSTLHKKTMHKSEQSNYSSVLDNRISSTEQLVGIMKPVPRDIYERLKKIEDRVLFLEGISPEYKNFWVNENSVDVNRALQPSRKRTYSTAELDTKLHELEKKCTKKMR